MKKIFIVLLMLLLPLITMQRLEASTTEYIWNPDNKDHGFTHIDPNHYLLYVNDVLIFEKGVMKSTDYDVYFELSNNLKEMTIQVLSTGSWVRVSYDTDTEILSATGFGDKTGYEFKFVYDSSIPETIYRQIRYLYAYYNGSTYIPFFTETQFVEDGTLFLRQTKYTPTKNGSLEWDVSFYNVYTGIHENEISYVIDNMFFMPIYADPNVPELVFNQAYKASDYTHHYFTSSDVLHDFTSLNLNHSYIFVNGELIYERGSLIDYDFTVSNQNEILLIEKDTSSASFNNDLSLSNDFNEIIIIESVLPQNVYVFNSSKTLHPFTYFNFSSIDIYLNNELWYEKGINYTDYTIRVTTDRIQIQKLTERLNFYTRNDLANRINRQSMTQTVTLVYAGFREDTFKNDQVFSKDGMMFDFQKNGIVKLIETTPGIRTFQTNSFTSNLSYLETDKYYVFRYNYVGGTFLQGEIFPFFVNHNSPNIKIDRYNYMQSQRVVVKWTPGLEVTIGLINVRTAHDLRYQITVEETQVHELKYLKSGLPKRDGNLLLSFNDGNLFDVPDIEYVPKYETGTPIETEQPGYEIIDVIDSDTGESFDYEQEVTDDHNLIPVVVITGKSIYFDSNGGSEFPSQTYVENSIPNQSTSPTRLGYTFGGWYQIPPLYDSITALNNHSLSEIFESGNLLQANQLVENGDFSTKSIWSTVSPSDYTVSNNVATITTSSTTGVGIYQVLNVDKNAKYYYSAYCMNTNVEFRIRIRTTESINTISDSNVLSSGQSGLMSGILTQPQMTTVVEDVWFYLRLTSTGVATVRNAFMTNVQTLITNKQYSPLYQTTFDLMTDNQIKAQMDSFTQNPHYWIDFDELGWYPTQEELEYYYSIYQYYQSQAELDFDELTLYDFSQPINEDVYLIAKWIENPPGTSTITFNSMNGSYISPINVTNGTLLTRPSDPYREGYKFEGWFTNSLLTIPFDFTTEIIEEDFVLFAKWSLISTDENPISDGAQFFLDYWLYGVAIILSFGIIVSVASPKKKKWSRLR